MNSFIFRHNGILVKSSILSLKPLQPSHFGRTYAAYGGILIVASIVWGVIVDKKKPNRFEIIGSLVAISGAIIIFYTPCFCSVVHPTASLSELP
ncbi:MAG TPA: YnfA family protein [Nitrososphaeraceae archaeon]|nr:YnfA family protein [Nitrososphaeraceae archaeon]